MIVSQEKGNSKLNKDNVEHDIYFFEYENYKGRMASDDIKSLHNFQYIKGTSKLFNKCQDVYETFHCKS